MPNWLTCKLAGRHDYSVCCEDGAMFLRCSKCGRRSQGWQVAGKPVTRESRPETTGRRAPSPLARLSVARQD